MSVKSEALQTGEPDNPDQVKQEPAAGEEQQEESTTELIIDNAGSAKNDTSSDNGHLECPLLKKYLDIAQQWPHLADYVVVTGENNNGPYIKIENSTPDSYLLYRNNLCLVIRSSGSDLFCTLYTYKQHIFKGMVIKDFDKFIVDEATQRGVQLFLKELERDKYRVCSGAFTEDELIACFEPGQLKMIFIEKFEGTVVFRSRDCFSLVTALPGEQTSLGTSVCDSCLRLKLDLTEALRCQDPDPDMFDGVPDPGGDSLASFVEVCMEGEEEEEGEGGNNSRESFDKENQEEGSTESLFYTQIDVPRTRVKTKATKVSYKSLIESAILSSPEKMMKLTEIYDWILARYPVFLANKNGFQNSVRHNLSLNRIFIKVNPGNYGGNTGKGSFWAIDANAAATKSNQDSRLASRVGCKPAHLGNDHPLDAVNFKIRLPPKGGVALALPLAPAATTPESLRPKMTPVKILPKPAPPAAPQLEPPPPQLEPPPAATATDSKAVDDNLPPGGGDAVPSITNSEVVEAAVGITTTTTTNTAIVSIGQPVFLTKSDNSQISSLVKPLTLLKTNNVSESTCLSVQADVSEDTMTKILPAQPPQQQQQQQPLPQDMHHLFSDLPTDVKEQLIKDLPTNIKEQLKTGLPIILRPLDKPGAAISIMAKQPASSMPTVPMMVPAASVAPATEKILSGSAVTLTQREPAAAVPVVAPSPRQQQEIREEQEQQQELKQQLLQQQQQHIQQQLHQQLQKQQQQHQQLQQQLQQQQSNSLSQGTMVATTLSTKEFPKPPFSYKELCMIAIFYSPDLEMSLSSIYEHIKLWFPYFRQPNIGMTWQNSIRHNLSLNKCFIRIERATKDEKGGKWTFDPEDEGWRRLVVSNKWFETPVDAELFEHMAKACPKFQEKVYSKKSMFRTVPVSVKMVKSTTTTVGISSPGSVGTPAGILLTGRVGGGGGPLTDSPDIHSDGSTGSSGASNLQCREALSPSLTPPTKRLKIEPPGLKSELKEEVIDHFNEDPLG